jgi:molybdopterin/thiamine biosynthesis adenylyltransferase
MGHRILARARELHRSAARLYLRIEAAHEHADAHLLAAATEVCVTVIGRLAVLLDRLVNIEALLVSNEYAQQASGAAEEIAGTGAELERLEAQLEAVERALTHAELAAG